MERFQGMLVYVFIGIMTGVVSLNVYLDTEKRKLVPGNTDINCSLPNVTISLEHIETSVNSAEMVWVGWQSHFTKWIDFRGCTKTTSLSGIRNKSIDFSDPVLDCYRFCNSSSFMLSKVKCFCRNRLSLKQLSGFLVRSSSFVGNTNNVVCMYEPLTNDKHEFDEKRNGNCLYAFKDDNKLEFSNDFCKERKTSVCVVLSRTEFMIYDQKNFTWLNNSNKCKVKGTIFPSYSLINENKAKAVSKVKNEKQYWVATFRRPLHVTTCLAAILYMNRTLGKPNAVPCNTHLRSLCIGSVVSGDSTRNGGSAGTTGNGGSGGTTEKSDKIPGYVWGIVAGIFVLCILIAILLFLFYKKVSESKTKTKKRPSPTDKAVSLKQTQRAAQPKQNDKSATIEETSENEYHTIGASCHLSGSDGEIYHELHEKPRSQEKQDRSNYDHVTHAMIADNNHYDVFCKKGQSFNSDNVISDYDTTLNIRQQIEGEYDTAGGHTCDPELSEYDCIAGPSRANENSI